MNLDLSNRVFGVGHRIVTAIGAVAGVLVALGQYLDIIPPEYRSNKWYAVAAALVALGAAIKNPAAKAAVLLLVCALGGSARADDPQFGACWTTTCVGPRVAAPALSIDFKTGNVQAGFLPGFGYGFERVTDKIPWGLSVFANVRSTADGEKFAPSAMVDLFRYVHAGIGYQIGGHAYGLLTLGTDLGSAASPATPAK